MSAIGSSTSSSGAYSCLLACVGTYSLISSIVNLTFSTEETCSPSSALNVMNICWLVGGGITTTCLIYRCIIGTKQIAHPPSDFESASEGNPSSIIREADILRDQNGVYRDPETREELESNSSSFLPYSQIDSKFTN